MDVINQALFRQAASLIKAGKRVTAFTGAGISVESGIPSFRGEEGLWSKYDPKVLDLNYFEENPKHSWMAIREIFYDFFDRAQPNPAHVALAAMERNGLLQTVITQNIDDLHRKAGNKIVWEFHGNSRILLCLGCSKKYYVDEVDFGEIPPTCRLCGGLLKPDFVFFGESIPEPARSLSFREAELSDVFLVIGTTGEVMPACMIPVTAKENGARIVEVNITESRYTAQITDVFIPAKATEAMIGLSEALGI